MATFEMQQAAFNVAPSKSVLSFGVQETKGFVVTAKLDLDLDTVAKFRSEEILGQVVSEPLIPTGTYVLELKVVLTSKAAIDINVDVVVKAPGKPAEAQTMTFKGKKRGDVCQALAFVLIQ